MYEKHRASTDLNTYYRSELLKLVTEAFPLNVNHEDDIISHGEDASRELSTLRDSIESFFSNRIFDSTAYEHGRFLDQLARSLCRYVACKIRCKTLGSLIREAFPDKSLPECEYRGVFLAGVIWQCDSIAESTCIPPPSSNRRIDCMDSIVKLACIDYGFDQVFKNKLMAGLKNIACNESSDASLRRWSLRACYNLAGEIYKDKNRISVPPSKEEIDQLLGMFTNKN